MAFRKFLLVLGLSFLFSPAFAFADTCSLPDVCARVVITNFNNATGTTGNMTDNVFVGQSATSISSGTWFSVYDNGSFVNDPDIAGYADVPGLAIERLSGQIRVRLFGGHTDGSTEHVEGYIELSNGQFLTLQNDVVPSGSAMDNWSSPDQKGGTLLGYDGAWIENGKSYFFMGVGPRNDGYYSRYDLTPIISLLGSNPFVVDVGQNYVDPGATASDPEDGNLTASIVAFGTVSTSTVGTYPVNYNVTDSQGLAAAQVTRNVTVQCRLPVFTSNLSLTIPIGQQFTYKVTADSFQPPVFTIATSSLPSGFSFDGVNLSGIPGTVGDSDIDMIAVNNCGTTTATLHLSVNVPALLSSGGSIGSIVFLPSIRVSDEMVVRDATASSTVTISWRTNAPSDSRVAYGTTSASSTTGMNFGYSLITPTDTTLTVSHSVVINGIDPKVSNYFRPISSVDGTMAYGDELSTAPAAPVILVGEVIPTTTSTSTATTTSAIVSPQPTSPEIAQRVPVSENDTHQNSASPLMAIIRNNVVPSQNTVIRNTDVSLTATDTKKTDQPVTGRSAFGGMLGAAFTAVSGAALRHKLLATVFVLLGGSGLWVLWKRFLNWKKPVVESVPAPINIPKKK